MTELLVLRGIVEASPDEVAALLLDVRPGGRSPLAATGEAEPADADADGDGDGDEFTVTQHGSRITVAVDHDRRSVTQQGEWWYRGVTSVEPDPRGARVVHRIYNVADGQKWAVRFVSRGPLHAAPEAFAAQIARLGRDLRVDAWVEDD